MNRSSASLFLPAVILLAIGAAFYAKPWHNLTTGHGATPNGQEITFTQNMMASEITKLESAYGPRAKIVDAVNCTPANKRPSVFGTGPGHTYDCIAIFTNSPAVQRWCAFYDTRYPQQMPSYQGAEMCEGPPNPMQEP
jgi:hypothetical protein